MANSPWSCFPSTAAEAGVSSDRLSSSVERDAAYARSLAEQEDASLAWDLAGMPPSLPPSVTRASPAGTTSTAADAELARRLAGMPPSVTRARPAEAARATDGDAELARRLAGAHGGIFGSGLGSSWPSELMQLPSQLMQKQETSPYVACEIVDVAIEMLVDTGAQMSVISAPLMRQLKLEQRLDRSQQGVATGVGQASILGKLRGIPVKLGHVEFALDFSVLGVEEPMLILGIDQMRRFKCIVDMDKECIIFGGSGGVEVSFLRDPPSRMRAAGCPHM